MKAIVENIGPQRAQLYVKGLGPCFILVPVPALPTGVGKGDGLELVFSKDGRGPEEEVQRPVVTGSAAPEGAAYIRRSY